MLIMFTFKAPVLLLAVFVLHYTAASFDQEEVVTDYKPYEITWEDFKQHFGRTFSSAEEEDYRYGVFVDSLKTIEAHNKEYLDDRQSFFMGVGPFTDKSDDELVASGCSVLEHEEEFDEADTPEMCLRRQGFCTCYSASGPLPLTFDWRDKPGMVSPVLDQGECGSCFAFGVTTTLESQVKKLTGKSVRLSQQQLVDCLAKSCGKGGNVEESFRFLSKTGGAWSASDYPYTSGDGKVKKCPKKKHKAVAFVTGCKYGWNNEELLRQMVVKEGTVYVSVGVDPAKWKNYRGQIINSSSCVPKATHCLTLVGYGMDYWIAKNSWGKEWGLLGGYVKIARNNKFACQIGKKFVIPTVGKPTE